MRKPFDDRLIDAVRVTGPNALPSAVLLEMDGGEPLIFGTSLARVLSRLEQMSLQGILRQTLVVDERGRDRKAYSMGTGRIRRQPTIASFGGLATT